MLQSEKKEVALGWELVKKCLDLPIGFWIRQFRRSCNENGNYEAKNEYNCTMENYKILHVDLHVFLNKKLWKKIDDVQ